jgi:uncharacterized protein
VRIRKAAAGSAGGTKNGAAVHGFDWDEGNLEKNWEKHGVAFWECEEVFLKRPFLVRGDPHHSRMGDQRLVGELVNDLKAIVARHVGLRRQRVVHSVGNAADVFGRLSFAKMQLDMTRDRSLRAR